MIKQSPKGPQVLLLPGLPLYTDAFVTRSLSQVPPLVARIPFFRSTRAALPGRPYCVVARWVPKLLGDVRTASSSVWLLA